MINQEPPNVNCGPLVCMGTIFLLENGKKIMKICNYANSGPWMWGARSFYSLGTTSIGFSVEKGYRKVFSTTVSFKKVLSWTILAFRYKINLLIIYIFSVLINTLFFMLINTTFHLLINTKKWYIFYNLLIIYIFLVLINAWNVVLINIKNNM